MEYEGSIDLVSRKMKKIVADFHVLGLFEAKNHYSSEKQNPSVTRHGAGERKICVTATASLLKTRKLKLVAPHT
jgi:hypothetical protein